MDLSTLCLFPSVVSSVPATPQTYENLSALFAPFKGTIALDKESHGESQIYSSGLDIGAAAGKHTQTSADGGREGKVGPIAAAFSGTRRKIAKSTEDNANTWLPASYIVGNGINKVPPSLSLAPAAIK